MLPNMRWSAIGGKISRTTSGLYGNLHEEAIFSIYHCWLSIYLITFSRLQV